MQTKWGLFSFDGMFHFQDELSHHNIVMNDIIRSTKGGINLA